MLNTRQENQPTGAPVLNSKLILLALLSINQMVFAQDSVPLFDSHTPKLDNTLKECVAVSLKKVQQTQFGTFINATLTHKQSAGKCGCKSSVLSYSVIEILNSPPPPKGVDAPEWTRIYATFTPFKLGEKNGAAKEFAFMLQTADGRPNIKDKPVLRLSCASSP